MKKRMMFIVLTVAVLCIIFSCSKDSTDPTDSEAPFVAITHPANNSEFPEGTEITIIADATDNEEVKEVRFYIDGEFASLDETEPYEYIWDTGNTRDTDHTIYALAYDNSENNSISNTIFITLSPTEPVIDVDGNVYQTLVFGNQEWMVENLKVTHYSNGDPIPHVTDDGAWISTSLDAYCVYDNTPSNADTYGNLYNWYTVDDPRGLAPEGWHVPTDEEIMELEMYLGMSYSEAHNRGYRGTNEGSKIVGRADLWTDGALENDPEFDTSGFNFLPAGYRYYLNGNYSNMGNDGYLWSFAEQVITNNWNRKLYYNYTAVYRNSSHKRNGFSIRCVKD